MGKYAGRYDGKNVVVTGGTSGLGLATARLLADGGARVLITGRTQATLDSARERIGAGAVAVVSDAASMTDVTALAGQVEAELGQVDALFVNAGVTRGAPLEAMTEEVYDELLSVNTKGPYFTVQQLAPLLRSGGSVVLTTSIVNVLGMPALSAYAASKAALRSMTRSLARELLPRNVRVNAISPGPIDTGILARSMPAAAAQEMVDELTAGNPMLRMGDPDEVARAVAFLAFDATYTTGAEFPIDGGASQL